MTSETVKRSITFTAIGELSLCQTHFRDQNQKTPLHLAASRGSKRCAISILANRPDCLNALDENKVSLIPEGGAVA